MTQSSQDTLSGVMIHAWQAVLVDGQSTVMIQGQSRPVTRTRSQGLRIVSFVYEGHQIDGIEQNPEKTSQWAKLAQEGKRIMQFRSKGRFIGNVCEGRLLRYPAWKSQGLPD